MPDGDHCSHGITLGGFGNEWIFGRTTLALPSLFGFFCLSGFLIIAGSATNNRVGRYLWQRFLRIMPRLLGLPSS